MTDAIVPHIAHFSRCRTSVCRTRKNRQISTVAPAVMPMTKWISKTWFSSGKIRLFAVNSRSPAANVSDGTSCASDEEKPCQRDQSSRHIKRVMVFHPASSNTSLRTG